MKRLIAQNPQNAERILPYIGGQEVNNHPRQEHHRYVINLDDLEEEQARYSWPDLLEIVEDKVRREREKLKDNTDGRKYKKF
jgi:hypothetical protein